MSRLMFVTAVLCASSVPALADHKTELAEGVEAMNHDKHSAWIADQLMTLNLPDKCWAKLLDKKNQGLALIASDTRSIADFAKVVTGDDWKAIEGQSANSKDENVAATQKKFDAFKSKFHVTLNLEGDDCTASGNALWMKYLGSAVGSLKKYPPKAGEANIVVNVKSSYKDFKVDVAKDGKTFTIEGPRDTEKAGWSDKIETVYKRVSSKG